LLFEFVFVVIALVFFGGVVNKWFFSSISAPAGANWTEVELKDGSYRRIGNINVLVLGVDSVDGTHRADTIFVLGVNPAKSRVSMLSIPRDTRVLISGKARKINEILPRYGQSVLRSLLEDLLSIQISRYVEVDFQGFINVIDAIGGVELDIEKPMHYDDNWGKVHIHFDPGKHRLDGRKALNFVRFRADAAADLGRIKRQQQFIKVLLDTFMTPGSVVKLPQIISEAYEHVKTDFSLAELFTLVKGFESYQVRFQNASLPGEARYIDKISYFLPYRDKAVEIGASHFSDLAAVELVASFTSPIEPQNASIPENQDEN
jgi:LCP family protein required for cell wall assembly